MATSVSGSEIDATSSSADGPVLSLVNKKLRALKKKYCRIIQLEESKCAGKTLNKEQSDLLNSKLQISVLIEEYEKLRQPLSVALQEELSRSPNPSFSPKDENFDAQLEDVIRVLYFGCLFDVKSVSQSEFARQLLTRMHERGCCLTYDYVTEDATELLGEGDLDMISELGGLLTTRPVYEGISHKAALESCVRRAKMWMRKSEEPIMPGVYVTYAGLREKLNKIMALDYFTMTPEMKAPVDVAAAVGMYNNTGGQMQTGEAGTIPTLENLHINDASAYYQQKEEEHEEFQAVETSINVDQSSPLDETEKGGSNEPIPSEDNNTAQHDQERAEQDSEHNPIDSEQKEQHQFPAQRAYRDQRGGRAGGGPRRGFSHARGGGRRGRGGDGGGYQNGRSQQYYDSGYNPRNYYNPRGRGGGRHINSYGAANGVGPVELDASS